MTTRPLRMGKALQRRLTPGITVAGVMVAFVAVNVYLWRRARGDDWSSIFVAARLVARGHLNAIYDHDPIVFSLVGSPRFDAAAADVNFTGPGHPYVHLPLLAYILSPLARLGSFPLANSVLVVLNILATLGVVWFAGKLIDSRLTRPAALAAALLVVTLSEPMRYSLFLGQTTPIVLFAVVYALYLARQGHPVPAGLLLALATAIKLTPVIVVVYWLWTRRRRAAASFTVSIVTIAAASVLLVGWQSNLDYVDTLRRISSSGLATFNNQSVVGWLLTHSVAKTPNRVLDFSVVPIPLAFRFANLMLLAATAGATIWRVMSAVRRGADPDRMVMPALFLLPLLFTPISWTHYYLAMVVPIFALTSASIDARTQWGAVFVGLLVLLNLQPLAADAVRANTGILLHSHVGSAVLALAALLFLPTVARDTPDSSGYPGGQPLQRSGDPPGGGCVHTVDLGPRLREV